jgi:uncharacterized protein
MYTKEQQKFLLTLARDAIKFYLKEHRFIKSDPANLAPEFLEKKGVFVTLTIKDSLRGCIGSIMPVKSLYLDVIDNAVNAAFRDPRFGPLTDDEFNILEIEISVLSVPRELEYENAEDLLKKLKTHIDGVILSKGPYYKATYLPQVWEDLKDKEAFLSSLCVKAGLPSDEWKKGKLKVETYQVEKFEEN